MADVNVHSDGGSSGTNAVLAVVVIALLALLAWLFFIRGGVPGTDSEIKVDVNAPAATGGGSPPPG